MTRQIRICRSIRLSGETDGVPTIPFCNLTKCFYTWQSVSNLLQKRSKNNRHTDARNPKGNADQDGLDAHMQPPTHGTPLCSSVTTLQKLDSDVADLRI